MNNSTAFDRHSLAILATAVTWGCFWIPLRQLDLYGNGSIVFTGASFALPFLFFVPRLLRSPSQILQWSPLVWLLGFTFALAACLYAEGTLRGNVARVILLFYLTPVWSTLLARVFLNEPITARRLLTLCLGLLGMTVILGGGNSLPLPQTAAEWMGLVAGMAWAIAMVCVQKSRQEPVVDISCAIFMFYPLIFFALSLIPGGREWTFNSTMLAPAALLWILAVVVIWHIPGVLLTIWGARVVEPGKVAILLMVEVIVGVGTAAWLTDEAFGQREVIGTILILGAGIVEFLPLPGLKKR